METKPEISVVLPVYNEAGNIPVLTGKLEQTLSDITLSYEIIFINDGSVDDSMDKIRNLAEKNKKIKFLDFSRNFGHQIAVMAGIDHAAGKAIVIMDADLQDPPEVIPILYRKYMEGYEVVHAKRKSRKGESKFKKISAKWFYRVLQKMTSFNIPVDTGDFRIIDQKVADILRQMPEYSKYLRGLISWVGFNQAVIEYDRAERLSGKTNYPLRKMLKFSMDAITAFSDVPLKLATFLGFFVSVISFLVLIYSLYVRIIKDEAVSGWASIITSVLFIGGIQLICIGIIGEYISRINMQVKNRPLYVIRDKNFSNL